MTISAATERLAPEPATALKIGDRVHIIGEPGDFLVSAIDRRRHAVSLVPLKAGGPQFGIHVSAVCLVSSGPVPSLFRRDRQLINEILDGKLE